MTHLPGLTATVRALEAGDNPPITIYHVTLENASGVWTETIGSREQLDWFLRGVTAATHMLGFAGFREPEIPREPNT